MSRLLFGAQVQANGIRQHYLRYGGKGPKLLILPGITSPAVTWGFIAEELAETMDVYVLDIRGRGLSDTGPELDYSLGAMAGDVRPFIDAVGIEGCIVLGHSMGARIAMRAQTGFDLDARSIILADPPVAGPGRRKYPMGIAWYVDSIHEALHGMTADDMRIYCPNWTEEQRALRAQWLHTCYKPAIVEAYQGFHRDDIFPDVPKLPDHVMLMAAGKGGVIQPEDIAEFKADKPAIDVQVVKDAGHMIPWDDLGTFLRLTRDFVGKAGA
ncbi:alpha/beta fold hydrolase [Ruegeria sp. Ofav3-42]|uniref:alpha/beta fold hydrolase n=1 Tax=Ruegeria sp. Ofav3-42 TaxID=2917759 RepID=UPI001EF71577|nr:alpha/beta hydrolase [Ruegeria sp. Ofav3-42]MCG7522443.1 alpha/beta hydrolase [Ruegeria sp. Ofav3-42]